MRQLDRCSYCGHEFMWHSGFCRGQGCDCKSFVPEGQTSEQTQALRNKLAETVMSARPTRHFVGRWVINWAWVAEIEDHGDGTCTLIRFDRSKTPVPFENGSVIESKDGKRVIVAVSIDGRGDLQPRELKVRNQKHVFSYTGDKS